ncbi:hypothetical protein N7478_001892 [Penicillium angulare]|uniref:uncharacterized protein n=1 Tax=Penicillium angulare TaxID=116970 RepID=UPI0025419FE1|nr:uncharacterized protein N7478_001892 [Penicillium angulare]KAJ5288862.1 hypothetical protein N7478_001892 [Penicillium angulare]
MKIARLPVAGTVLVSATAASPLGLLTRYANILNYSTLSCVENIEYNPLRDANCALDWCTDMTFLNRLNQCTMNSCSTATEEFLTTFEQWCTTASIVLPPNQFHCKKLSQPYTSTPNAVDDTNLNTRNPPNWFNKRYISNNDNSYSIAPGAVIAIVVGSIAGIIALLCAICSCNRNTSSGRLLPMHEPRRGRPTPAPRSERPNLRSTMRTRSPSPPPPYIAEPEVAHVKDGPDQSGLPSYEDRPRGSNALY